MARAVIEIEPSPHEKGIRRALIAVGIVISLAFSLLFSGCLFGPRCSFFGPRGCDEQGMENYLTQKYGDVHYTVTNYKAGFGWSGNPMLTAKITDGPYKGYGFEVIVDADNLGNPIYQDSYYHFLIENQYRAMIKQVANGYFKHYVVSIGFEDFAGDVSPSMTVEQVLTSGKMANNDVALYVDVADFTQNGKFDKNLFRKQTDAFGTAWCQASNQSLVNSQTSNESTVSATAVSGKTLKKLSQDPDYPTAVEDSPKLIIYEHIAGTNY
jgi:hypothetical protein